MKNYFSSFSKDSLNKDPAGSKNILSCSKFMAKRIYKGYIDDPRNTDNSWIEAEIWNFHYGDDDRLDEIIPNVILYFLFNF